MENSENKITCEIVEELCVLREYEESGWRKELNLVSWNGAEPVYDIRGWSKDHKHKGRGVTLTAEEAEAAALYIMDHIQGAQEETA